MKDEHLSEALHLLRAAKSHLKKAGLSGAELDNLDVVLVIIEDARGREWQRMLRDFAKRIGLNL